MTGQQFSAGQFSGRLPAGTNWPAPQVGKLLEPGVGTVVRFRVKHDNSGRYYDYAAIRAGDGKWYITGGETKQGVDWGTLIDAVQPLIEGPLWILSDRTGYKI